MSLQRLQSRLKAGQAFALDFELLAGDELKLLKGLRKERFQVALEVCGRARAQQLGDPDLRIGKELLSRVDHRQFLTSRAGACWPRLVNQSREESTT
jgi:hypothetical protein